MKRTSILAALLTMVAAAVSAEPVEIQAGQTKVTLEFFTPQTVPHRTPLPPLPGRASWSSPSPAT